MKRGSISLVIMKMKLLVTMRHHQILIRVAKMNKPDNCKHRGRCGARGAHEWLMGVYISTTTSKHGLASFWKLGVLSTEGQVCEAKDTHSQQHCL